MTLQEFALDYGMKAGVGPGYLHQLKVLTKRFDWTPADLTAKNIDAYLTGALEKLAPQTVANHRRMLNTLRKHAIRAGLVNDCTETIRRVKAPADIPVAWSHAQIGKLIETARNMPRGSRHVQWRVLLPAYILVAYSSGLRLGDMMAIRHDSLRGNRLGVVMGKTGRPHVCVLDKQAMDAIATLPVRGLRIFGDLVGRCVFLRAFRRLVKRAGLTGSGKYLRRSSATFALIAGIDPTGHLGHRTAGLALKHYVDPVLVAETKRAIPSLGELQPGRETGVPAEKRRSARSCTADTAAADLAAWM